MASAAAVRAGERLVVSSSAAGCDLHLTEEARYSVTLASKRSGAAARSAEFTTRVAPDGRFSVGVVVPHDFPVGRARLLVTGSPLDDCGDRASCAAYQLPVQIIAA